MPSNFTTPVRITSRKSFGKIGYMAGDIDKLQPHIKRVLVHFRDNDQYVTFARKFIEPITDAERILLGED